jgi:nucleotide-binding universal stress UspA family protein
VASSYDYRVILVAVDFSAASREALARATDLAVQLDARLEIVHVVRKHRAALPFSSQNRATVARLQREEVDQAKQALERWKPKRRGLEVRLRVRAGLPSEGILAQAEKSGADLVVLSNLGHSSFQEILIGSTAERCMRNSSRPIMLVPQARPGR